MDCERNSGKGKGKGQGEEQNEDEGEKEEERSGGGSGLEDICDDTMSSSRLICFVSSRGRSVAWRVGGRSMSID